MNTTENLGLQIHQVATSLARHTDQILMHNLGIGFSQFKILMALQEEEGVQQKQLAERLGQTEASISRQVKGLQTAKLLTARVNPDNRRERITVLSDRGLATVNEARDLLDRHYAPMLSGVSSGDIRAFKETLSVIHRYIN